MNKENPKPSAKSDFEIFRKNFACKENPDNKNQGSVCLDLGIKRGETPGYPRLVFIKDPSIECVLHAVESESNARPLTLDEMKIFVEVSRHFAPNSPITEALVTKVYKLSLQEHGELQKKAKVVKEIILLTFPKS